MLLALLSLQASASEPHYECSQVTRKIIPRRVYGNEGVCAARSSSSCDLAKPDAFLTRCPAQLPARPLFAGASYGARTPHELEYRLVSGRCAIVGSGGSLLGSGCGAQIDAHDAIFRANVPLMNDEYAPDVGRRTDFMILNDMIARNLGNWNAVNDPHDPNHRPINLEGMGVVSLAENKNHIQDVVGHEHELISKHHMNSVLGAKSSFSSAVDSWLRNVHYGSGGRNMNEPSKGMRTLALALTTCDEIDIYGFSHELPGQPYHYWDARVDWHTGAIAGLHAINLEHKVLDVLAQGSPVTVCMSGHAPLGLMSPPPPIGSPLPPTPSPPPLSPGGSTDPSLDYPPARGCDHALHAYCASPQARCSDFHALLARWDLRASSDPFVGEVRQWRCYARSALAADGARTTGLSSSYCTRDVALRQVLATCLATPVPLSPPPPQTPPLPFLPPESPPSSPPPLPSFFPSPPTVRAPAQRVPALKQQDPAPPPLPPPSPPPLSPPVPASSVRADPPAGPSPSAALATAPSPTLDRREVLLLGRLRGDELKLGYDDAPKSADTARERDARASTGLATAALCVSGFLVCFLVCCSIPLIAVRKARPRRQAAMWKARSRRVGTITATSVREEEEHEECAPEEEEQDVVYAL